MVKDQSSGFQENTNTVQTPLSHLGHRTCHFPPHSPARGLFWAFLTFIYPTEPLPGRQRGLGPCCGRVDVLLVGFRLQEKSGQ